MTDKTRSQPNSAEHARTPWRVFTNDNGTKLVGIGGLDGEGILDAGFGVWAWNDQEGIANAAFIVKAVNNHDALVTALRWFANPACWRLGGSCDPNSGAFRGLEIAQNALAALENQS